MAITLDELTERRKILEALHDDYWQKLLYETLSPLLVEIAEHRDEQWCDEHGTEATVGDTFRVLVMSWGLADLFVGLID